MFRHFGGAATALVMFSALASATAKADSAASQPIALCDGKFGLCRYIDAKTRQEVIPARFERAMRFSDGFAAVRIGGRYGYIDVHGDIVIEPKFDLAGEFSQGLAEILVGDKTGVINRAGDIVVPPMFGRAIPFTKDVIIASEGTWSRAHFEGFEELPSMQESTLIPDTAGLYHVSGHWVRPPTLSQIRLFTRDGRGLIWATEGERREAFGLLGGDGQWVIEPHFDYAASPSDGRAIVRKKVDGAMLAGAVDATGRLVVPLRAWSLFYWRDGWGMVRENGKEGLIDVDGNLIGGRFFDKVERGEPDIAAVSIDGKWQGIDRAGNIVPHPRYDAQVKQQTAHLPNPQTFPVLPDCGHGLRLFERDGLWGIADADGKDVIAPRYRALVCFKNGIAWAPIDDRRQWCAIGPDSVVRDRPACKTEHYPHILTHSVPETFHADPFENSVLWTRAYVEFTAGKRESPPRWLSDGTRGGPRR